jgi:hypothetical protein
MEPQLTDSMREECRAYLTVKHAVLIADEDSQSKELLDESYVTLIVDLVPVNVWAQHGDGFL